VQGLKAATSYKLFAFTYNKNEPQNTFIKYSDAHLSMNLVTDSSIYLLQALPQIVVKEDSLFEQNLVAYIFDSEDNEYTVNTENTFLNFEFDANVMTVSALDNFNGTSTVELVVENAYESRIYALEVIVVAVNDAPFLAPNSGTLTIAIEPTTIKKLLYDVDNLSEDLSISIASDNDAIIATEEIEFSIDGDSLSISFTPLMIGNVNLQVTVSDGELEIVENYSIEVESSILSNQKALNSLKVYPNPVVDYIYIQGNISSVAYKIYSLDGTIKLEGKRLPKLLNIGNLPTGIYILDLGVRKLKLIKE